MSSWNILIEYINKKDLGDCLFRNEILNITNSSKNQNTTVDNQRNWLTKCGYLEKIKDGQYIIRKYIDNHLTANDIRKMAYNEEYRINHDRSEKLNRILK
jgi:hypothetical protein